MNVLDWIHANPGWVLWLTGTTVTLCSRFMASSAWEEESKLHPTIAMIIRIIAFGGTDIIGAAKELTAEKSPPPPPTPMFPVEKKETDHAA